MPHHHWRSPPLRHLLQHSWVGHRCGGRSHRQGWHGGARQQQHGGRRWRERRSEPCMRWRRPAAFHGPSGEGLPLCGGPARKRRRGSCVLRVGCRPGAAELGPAIAPEVASESPAGVHGRAEKQWSTNLLGSQRQARWKKLFERERESSDCDMCAEQRRTASRGYREGAGNSTFSGVRAGEKVAHQSLARISRSSAREGTSEKEFNYAIFASRRCAHRQSTTMLTFLQVGAPSVDESLSHPEAAKLNCCPCLQTNQKKADER